MCSHYHKGRTCRETEAELDRVAAESDGVRERIVGYSRIIYQMRSDEAVTAATIERLRDLAAALEAEVARPEAEAQFWATT